MTTEYRRKEEETENTTMLRPGRTDQSLTDEYLQERLENLEEEWKSMKYNHPEHLLHLVDGSPPRSLMSSLQNSAGSTSGEIWKVRNNGLAAEEIARERKAAIESGKFKGRRLFEVYDDESEGGSVISDGDEAQVGGTEAREKVLLPPVSSVCSGSCSCSCSCSSACLSTGVDQKVGSDHLPGAESLWRRWRGFMGLISIAVAVFATGVLLKSMLERRGDEKLILVPT